MTTAEPIVLARFFVPGLPARPARRGDGHFAAERWSSWATRVRGFATRAGYTPTVGPCRIAAVVRDGLLPGPSDLTMGIWRDGIRAALAHNGLVVADEVRCCLVSFEPLPRMELAERPIREGVEITIVEDR